MKKLLMIAVALLVSMAMSAQSTVTIDNVVYEYSGTTATVKSCENIPTVVIKDKITVSEADYTVTGI